MNFEKDFISFVCSFAFTNHWIAENGMSICLVEGTQAYMREKIDLIDSF
jgi:hypothetical protein